MPLLWRKKPRDLVVDAAEPEPEALIRCRHCGSAQVKLTYRRKEAEPTGEKALTLIYRCGGCDQFTTVRT